MNVLLILVNEVACLLAMYSAMTLYLQRRPMCARAHATQLALLLVAAGSFGGFLTPLYHGAVPSWWDLFMRVGIAVIALRSVTNAKNRRRFNDDHHRRQVTT